MAPPVGRPDDVLARVWVREEEGLVRPLGAGAAEREEHHGDAGAEGQKAEIGVLDLFLRYLFIIVSQYLIIWCINAVIQK